MGYNWVFDPVLPSRTGFFLFLFFFQPILVPIPGQPAEPDFKTIVLAFLLGFYTSLFTLSILFVYFYANLIPLFFIIF